MINKLRRRFILVAMLSTVVVLVAIVGGMNIMNYRQLQADADRTNKMITDNNGTFPNNNGGDRNAPKPGDDNQSGDGESTVQQDTTGKSGNGSADQQDTTGKSGSEGTDNQRPDGNQPPQPPQGGKQNGGSDHGDGQRQTIRRGNMLASSLPAIWAKCHRRLRLRQDIFPWCWMPPER